MSNDKIENMELEQLSDEICKCTLCPLAVERNNAVPGKGASKARLMLIGEGPGGDEDKSGLPFVGRAGELLTKILSSVNINREEIFITNVVKCRPPGNRDPLPEEMNACWPYLARQIELIQPAIILSLGRVSTSFLLSLKKFKITKEHGNVFHFSNSTILIPVYHPSYLLRNPSKEQGSPKHQMWEDMKKVKELYDKLEK